MALPRSQQGSATLPSARGSVPCCCPSLGSPPCFCPPFPSLFAPRIPPGPPWSLDFGWVRFWGCQRERKEAAWPRRGCSRCCPDGNAVGKKAPNPQIVCLGGGKTPPKTQRRGERELWGCYGAHPGGPAAIWGSQPACYPMDKPLVRGGGFPRAPPAPLLHPLLLPSPKSMPFGPPSSTCKCPPRVSDPFVRHL